MEMLIARALVDVLVASDDRAHSRAYRQESAFAPFEAAIHPGRMVGSFGHACASIVGKTILVVEDNDDFRELTAIILRGAGYQVLAAAAGPSAMELAANHQGDIDVLVTDVGLPGMDGVELAEAAKARRPELRVLLMSGIQNPTATARPTSGAGFSTLQKPFKGSELLEAVRQLLTPVDKAP